MEDNIPKPLKKINWNKLKKLAKEVIDQTIEDGRTDDDYPHHIFEETMQTIYGKQFWEWYNKVNG